jgi:hypothetical protein
MKRLYVFLLMLTCSLAAREQTLFSGQMDHGGYGGPVLKYTQIGPNGADGILTGGQGGWIIDHKFVIGGGGYGLTNNISADWYDMRAYDGEPYVLDFGYGGLLLGFISNSDALVHYEIFSLIGAGGINYRVKDDYNQNSSSGDAIFVAEPGINIMLNVTDFFRIGVGGTYRFARGVELPAMSDADLSNFSAQIIFKFGAF